MASLPQYCFNRAGFITKKSFGALYLSNTLQIQPCNYHNFSRRPGTLPLSLRLSGSGKLDVINNNSIGVGKSSKKLEDDKWKLFGIDDGSRGTLPPSVTKLIQDFYKAANAKDRQHLEQLLSNDCSFQDIIFYENFHGKESVMRIFSSVMDAMGPNFHMVVENVIEGEDLTAFVIWHLEWKDRVVPFNTGCSFFECEEIEGKLFIKNITGVEELPVKPGELVLKVLKAVGTLFDLYPFIAIGLLPGEKPEGTHEGFDYLLDILRKRRPST